MNEEELLRREEQFLFSPEKGNVAFASAYDNWGFTLDSFAPKIAKMFGMRPKALVQFLWGKYYFKTGDKKVVKKPPSENSKEMFVQYVLEPLVKEYRKLFSEEMLANTQLMKSAHNKIKTVMNKLTPLDNGILSMAIEKLPSPLEA